MEYPFVLLGQIASITYFGIFIVLFPLVSTIEKKIMFS